MKVLYEQKTSLLKLHCVLRNFRKNKDIVITKPNKGNGVVILHRKLYNNAIEEIYSDTSKFQKLSEDPTLKREASLQGFLGKLKKKKLMKLNMITCIFLVLLLLVSMILLKCTSSPLMIHFLNFVQLFHLQVLLIIILPLSFAIFFHL